MGTGDCRPKTARAKCSTTITTFAFGNASPASINSLPPAPSSHPSTSYRLARLPGPVIAPPTRAGTADTGLDCTALSLSRRTLVKHIVSNLDSARCLSCVYLSVCLPAGVPAINDEVRARCVGAGIRAQVQVDALQLPGICVTLHRRQVKPGLLHRNRAVPGDCCVDVSWRDAVAASAPLGPFYRHRLGQVDLVCFVS